MKIFSTRNAIKFFALLVILSGSIFAQNAIGNEYVRRWIPIKVYGENILNSKAFIEFNESENRLNGNAGCNRMFGTYRKNGRNITFSGVGTTRMFCSEKGAMNLEAKLLRSLSEATRFQQSGDLLRLYSGKRLISTFRKTTENTIVIGKIEERKWILKTINNKKVPETETAAFLIFNKEKGSAGGNTSCNAFGGSYVSESKTLKVSKIISTQRACIEDERMNVEREFLKALQSIDRFEIKLDKLYLYEGRKLLLTFTGHGKD